MQRKQRTWPVEWADQTAIWTFARRLAHLAMSAHDERKAALVTNSSSSSSSSTSNHEAAATAASTPKETSDAQVLSSSSSQTAPVLAISQLPAVVVHNTAVTLRLAENKNSAGALDDRHLALLRRVLSPGKGSAIVAGSALTDIQLKSPLTHHRCDFKVSKTCIIVQTTGPQPPIIDACIALLLLDIVLNRSSASLSSSSSSSDVKAHSSETLERTQDVIMAAWEARKELTPKHSLIVQLADVLLEQLRKVQYRPCPNVMAEPVQTVKTVRAAANDGTLCAVRSTAGGMRAEGLKTRLKRRRHDTSAGSLAAAKHNNDDDGMQVAKNRFSAERFHDEMSQHADVCDAFKADSKLLFRFRDDTRSTGEAGGPCEFAIWPTNVVFDPFLSNHLHARFASQLLSAPAGALHEPRFLSDFAYIRGNETAKRLDASDEDDDTLQGMWLFLSLCKCVFLSQRLRGKSDAQRQLTMTTTMKTKTRP
jgi:hypothetical protein